MDIKPTGNFSQILGTGAAVLDGAGDLDVSAVTGTSGSWMLVNTRQSNHNL